MVPFFDVFLILFVGLAAGFDLREQRIPNWLTLLALIGGLVLNFRQGVPQLLSSLAGLGLGVGIFMIPFALGWLGAGDVKFLGSVGAILGVQCVPRVLFYTTLLGWMLALISIALRGVNLQVLKEAGRDIKLLLMSHGAVLPETVRERSLKGVRTVPYGVAIGLGTLVTFYVDPKGDWAGF